MSRTTKRRMVRVALGIGAVLAGLSIRLVAATALRWDRTFDAPYPALTAGDDPAVIAHGRFLVYGPANCANCHSPAEAWSALLEGEELPLVGGYEVATPAGTFRSPNLTPDPETGIGHRSDEELFRILRYGVRADGRAALPFMEYQNLSDEDLVAIVSFLRSQPPVHHEVRDHKPSLLGRFVMAFLLRPVGPDGTPPALSPWAEPTVERGAYLVEHVAGCGGCHTQRDLRTGAAVGPHLAGGFPREVQGVSDYRFTPPNLTPDPTTGVIAAWTEEDFVARFRAGSAVPLAMPWEAYGRMEDADLRAMYRYLMSLPPVEYDPGPRFQPVRQP